MQSVLQVFGEILSGILSALALEQLGITPIDLIILAVIVFYAFEGYVLGFLLAFFDLASFFLSFLLALSLYDVVGKWLSVSFSLPPGIASAIGFFIVALISEVLLSILLRRLRLLFPTVPHSNPIKRWYEKAAHPLGILPGLASAYIILSFLLMTMLALPSSAFLKEMVSSSRFGSLLIAHTAGTDRIIKDVFGGAIDETLNFITIKPQSDEMVNLHFTVNNPTVDPKAENEMLAQVNKERRKNGLSELAMDPLLQHVSRKYAKDMLQRGYFSHYNPEGQSPFDRMEQEGVSYLSAGENLALAPSVQMAHQGLMNSPGHRANILSPNFHKVGIGVMDGGIYGKMFVQTFTN